MIKAQEQSFFLVETDTKGEQYPMQKSFNGNGFQRIYDPSQTFKFSDEEKVKRACQVQNMMNSVFGSTGVVSYAKETIQRDMYDENGEPSQVTETEADK
ncbi:hypothetical protein NW133_07440 [Staphylococcus pettenkoferi]|uniref:Phage portal protein n=1 Tax=Staphylococcus pettenkoferi TaxID=170573 RepID=A0ABT4BL16_9STAP|nr:hypothetical protein [Staphylococcus pettenkoferi]MCY1563808.1 hypothetical protein [Staphylococcus pettenkoferi]MCY1583361.1 hypothetical protein [Staphylococcus pettenkoferi]